MKQNPGRTRITRYLVFGVWGLTMCCLLAGCSEKLPEGPGTELDDVLKVTLTTDFDGYAQENSYRNDYQVPDGMTWPEFNQYTAWIVYFRLRLENVFDEPVVGTKYIDATIKVWNKNDTTRVRTLTVVDTTSDDLIIIEPGEEYTVFAGDRFVWYQTDDQERPIAPKDTFDAYVIQERMEYNKYTDVYFRHCDTLSTFQKDSVFYFRKPLDIRARATVQIMREYRDMYWRSEEILIPITFLSHAGWTSVETPCKQGYVIENP